MLIAEPADLTVSRRMQRLWHWKWLLDIPKRELPAIMFATDHLQVKLLCCRPARHKSYRRTCAGEHDPLRLFEA